MDLKDTLVHDMIAFFPQLLHDCLNNFFFLDKISSNEDVILSHH